MSNMALACEDEVLYKMLGKVCDNLEEYKGGNLIMTDDKAPVELLGMRVIDDMIWEEVAYYKEVFERDGLEGVLRDLI